MNKLTSLTVAGLLFTTHQIASAASLDISNVPLYLGGSVEPNIMFTLDDSGSMQFEVMPDEIRNFAYYMFPRPSGLYGASVYTNQVPNFDDDNIHNYYLRSAENNKVFYNPDIDYVPWSTADGGSRGNANPYAAYYNPEDTSRGSMNLLSAQTQYACWYRDDDNLTQASGDPCYGNHSFWPITYYNYDGSGSRYSRSNYDRVQITNSTPSSATFTSPGGITRNRDQEIQNFANWFQYYRSRVLMARAGVGQAFATQGTNMRVGFAAINQGGKTVDGVWSSSAVIDGVRGFSGTPRGDFFDRLYGHTIDANGTPLRSAAKNVGEYFERDDDRGPWGNVPGSNDPSAHLTCRQSYHILTTDGYWNGGSPSVGNSDNTAGPVISGPNQADYQYLPTAPYADSHSNTLADVAMDYWKRDLRPNLDNEVTTNQLDPAFWQHMVTFTVGLGVNGTLDPDSDYADLAAGNINWPQPGDDREENIDDMWHAAINGRGSFFSAADPNTFADSLGSILSNINSRESSAAAVALNSGSASSGSRIYQARFNSGDWTGQLLAYGINNDATLTGELWDAGTLIPNPGQRKIITSNNNTGQPFRWASLNASQKATLNNSSTLLSYLRGNASNELSNGGSYRNRTRKLGDIINSAPTYSGAPSSRHPNGWGTGQPENNVPYSSFVLANKNRTPLIFVGANDGMLHAFNATSGVEEFAYIPSTLFEKLPALSDPDYSHRYYVDGSPTVIDAFFSDNTWRTVLVSSLGAGGQGIFALDVTDRSAFASEAGGAAKVLWEFDDDNDRDMGFTIGQASIVRLNNGQWAALFSGGYDNNDDNGLDGNNTDDSLTGNAVMYLVNIQTGALIKKFDTLAGTADDPTGNNRPNGLSSPSAIDINNDGSVDAVYAGDLFGNVWSIDLTGNDPNAWDFKYKSGSDPVPLFTACYGNSCSGSNVQPITTRIEVVKHPRESGYLLLFGTGKYFEVGDNATSGQVTQSFYGIWDKRQSTLTPFGRSTLQEQKIIQESVSNNTEYRVTSNNAVDWNTENGWYLDLYNQQSGNTTNYGERQVSNSVIRNGRVIFTTLIPSDDPCDAGGTGWLMEVNYASGSRLSYSPFDVNGDNSFGVSDYINVGDIDGDGNDDYVPSSGKKSKVGIIARPSIMDDPSGQRELKFNSGADGNIEVTVENPGPGTGARQSWRQLDY
ncbi:pilus assembly protein [Methylophaga sp. OBS1]|uniref:pilus assembly protein n=1 Tax=Methylophaga sp. OBS1 TaxID=2991933 RepID=UPI00225C16A2|nr:PilC/PilY family type IV pilus protein [Methylophaga sp. OBS1]MCX4193824.1 PilC/PilY family type IV pilus protein [Methylophaga sp. OBS1]